MWHLVHAGSSAWKPAGKNERLWLRPRCVGIGRLDGVIVKTRNPGADVLKRTRKDRACLFSPRCATTAYTK